MIELLLRKEVRNKKRVSLRKSFLSLFLGYLYLQPGRGLLIQGRGLPFPASSPLFLDQLWLKAHPPPPASPLWRSGSATELTPLNLNCRLVSVSLVPLKLASMVMLTFQVHSMFTGNQSLRVRLMKERQWGYIPNRLFAA